MAYHIRVTWHGRRPPNYEKACRILHNDLTWLYKELDGRPERLIYHTVTLTRDLNGPSIHCWGDPDKPGRFQCEYHHKTKWVSLDEQ